jgi:hypothetical protein
MSGTSLLDSGFAETPACFVSTVSLFSVLAALRAFGILYRNPTLPTKLKNKSEPRRKSGAPELSSEGRKKLYRLCPPAKVGRWRGGVEESSGIILDRVSHI